MSLRTHIARAVGALFGRSYDAGAAGKRWPASAMMLSPRRTQLAARYPMAARAGWLIANSPSGCAIAEQWATHLVGDGPSVRSGHPREAVRSALEEAWGRFYSACDVEGVHDLCGLLNGAVYSLVGTGEALFQMVTAGRGELRLRWLSPEQLDPALTREVEDLRRIVAGVEFDASGRRVAYHLFPEAPDLVVNMLGSPARIDAVDVLHVFEGKVAGQVRGVSWLHSVMTRLLELDKLEDALGARMNTAALFGGFIRDLDGSGGGFTDGAKTDPHELSLEPGTMRVLPAGTTVEFPAVPGAENADALLRHMIRAIASGAGLPPFLIDGNYGEINYSSGKLALETFKKRCAKIRATLLTARLLQPIWDRFVTLEVLSGRLSAPDFERYPEPYLAMTTMWPGWPALDPYREAQADVLLLRAGLRSRREIVEGRGRDYRDVLAEIEADTLGPALPAGTGTSIEEVKDVA
jgi:lambda family phage portal protein